MKCLATLFLIFAFPSVAFSATLTKIPYSSIGRDIKTLVPSANDVMLPTTMALRSESTYEAAANLLTIPLYAYNPMLGIGASAAIGYAFHGAYDVPKAYQNNVLQNKPHISPILQDLFGNAEYPRPASSDVFSKEYIAGLVPSYPELFPGSFATLDGKNWKLDAYSVLVHTYNGGNQPEGGITWQIDDSSTKWFYLHTNINGNYCDQHTFIFKSTTNPVNLEPPSQQLPETLTVEQLEALHQRLVESVANDQQVRQEIEDSVVENPDLVPDAENIKRTDVQQWSSQNSSGINNQYIAELEQLAAANPDNVQIQQELAQAQAEAQKEAETPVETFDPIPGIEVTPYDPGPFDIPSRFDTFLANIAVTGLFSLPSQFFGSLPAGGSPIYTINAGQYGTHSVDLSETMGSGLLVLKTLLIGCFTFLAVRVVVLKR